MGAYTRTHRLLGMVYFNLKEGPLVAGRQARWRCRGEPFLDCCDVNAVCAGESGVPLLSLNSVDFQIAG